MPGLVGIVSKDPSAERTMERMVSSMVGEPFYSFGTHIDSKLGAYCGWVAHKGSFADREPFWNSARDISVIFAGEDFSAPAVPAETPATNSGGRSDHARNLAQLYEQRGPQFVDQLNGWFCGVVFDRRRQLLLLFNDRYGLGRVYVYEDARGLYFASEAKSLLRVLPQVRGLDPQAAAEIVSCGCVLQNRTLFDGVSLLPGGSLWSVGYGGTIHKQKYFVPEQWEQQSPLNADDYLNALFATVGDVMPRYFRGPQRKGMSLTGGLDGRLIMSWAPRPPGELPCYTFGSSYRDTADVRIARRIASACRQPHETLIIGDEFLSDFPRQAEKAIWTSDGTMDVTGSAELYANAMAQKIAPVRITGNYGSELLRGNVAFRPRRPLKMLYDGSFEERIIAASRTYEAERVGNRLSFIAFKQVPWHHYSRLAVEQSQLTLRSPYLDTDLVSLLYRAPPPLAFSVDVVLRLIAKGIPTLAEIPTDRGVRARPIVVVDAIRRQWQELMTKAEYAYDYGMPQWLVGIDHRLKRMRPERLFLGRQKFCHFRIWYRDRLAGYVQEVLLDNRARSRPYLRKQEVERLLSAHVRGAGNYTLEISRLLSLELLQRILIESHTPG